MSPRFALHESLYHQLSLAARLQERRLEHALRAQGLTLTTWQILVAVGCEDLHQPSEIAAFIRIDRTATSRALRRMEAAGMIERSFGQSDRRTTEVRLTDTGNAALMASIPIAETHADHIDDLLSRQDRRDIRRLLAQLTPGPPCQDTV